MIAVRFDNSTMALTPWPLFSLTLIRVVLLAISCGLLLVFFAYRTFVIRYPSNLPRIGADKGITWSDMRKKYMTDCLSVFGDVYENVSLHQKHTRFIPLNKTRTDHLCNSSTPRKAKQSLFPYSAPMMKLSSHPALLPGSCANRMR